MSEQNRPEDAGQQGQGEQTPSANPWDAPSTADSQVPGADDAQNQAQEAGDQATQQFDAAQQQGEQQAQQWGDQATQQFDGAQQQGEQQAQQWGDQATQQFDAAQQQGQQQWGGQQGDAAQQQNPWGQQGASAGSAAQAPYGQQQNPWGQQGASAGSAAQTPYGQQQWGAQQQAQNPWGSAQSAGQPGYGGATPYSTGPYGQSAQKQGNKALPWIIGGSLIALIGLYALLAFLLKLWPFAPNLQQLTEECTEGNGASCNALYQAAEEGSEAEKFGQTCGMRTNGGVDCTDPSVDMTAPIYSYGDGAGADTGTDTVDVDPTDNGGTDTTDGQNSAAGSNYGDDPELDALYDACKGGDMYSCDVLFDATAQDAWDGDYYELAASCGGTESVDYEYYCSPDYVPLGDVN